MKENKMKIPLICKIKKRIIIGKPSTFMFCGYGLQHKSKKLCEKCPLDFKNRF